ncbi:uncharacterized protein EV422DRAFT_503078 [Fimicolochytrium jonesii]|uniref:uncharacterized protein n=1 Tax=Fimicolochytrium jonesii TaxID=1396493 RepID=UPI0022FF1117|nr:uncharacterized protein EV422DRAFT_503078 [Fimicolochytrium jonesii]KAI8825697.1 hypothetical protein EV422DRAFT_503078 [Fimicolochytrium jonesii]
MDLLGENVPEFATPAESQAFQEGIRLYRAARDQADAEARAAAAAASAARKAEAAAKKAAAVAARKAKAGSSGGDSSRKDGARAAGGGAGDGGDKSGNESESSDEGRPRQTPSPTPPRGRQGDKQPAADNDDDEESLGVPAADDVDNLVSIPDDGELSQKPLRLSHDDLLASEWFGVTPITGTAATPSSYGGDPVVAARLEQRADLVLRLSKVKVQMQLSACPQVGPQLVEDIIFLRYVDLAKIHPNARIMASDHARIEFHQGLREDVRVVSKSLCEVPINTFSRWCKAYDNYCELMLYLYPAFVRELHAYRKYLTSLCSTWAWHVVYDYDRAHRKHKANHQFKGFADPPAPAVTGLAKPSTLLLALELDEAGCVTKVHNNSSNNNRTAAANTSASTATATTAGPSGLSDPRAAPLRPQNDARRVLFQPYRVVDADHRARGIDVLPNEVRALHRPYEVQSTAELSESKLPYREPVMSNAEYAASAFLLRHGLHKIPSPVNPMALRHVLRGHPNQPLVESILRGLGFPTNSITPEGVGVQLRRNHPSSEEHADVVRDNLTEEILLGRRQAIDPDILRQAPYAIANPVGVVPKPNKPGKFRIIHNASFPKGGLLNDGIARDNFGPVPLDKVNVLVQTILKQKKLHGDISGWVVDTVSAYHVHPARPPDQLKQGIWFKESFYQDFVTQFGVRSARFYCCLFGDLLCWALIKLGLPNALHYVDNFTGFTAKRLLAPSLSTVVSFFGAIGVPIKVEASGQVFATHGFMFNLVTLTISIPPQKLQSIWELLIQILTAAPGSTDAATYNSVWPGSPKSFPPRTPTSGRNNLKKAVLAQDLREDLHWWTYSLLHWTGYALISEERWMTWAQLGAVSDPSPIGFGAHTRTSYTFGDWCSACFRDIHSTTLEMVAICIGLTTFGNQFPRKRIVWLTDNLACTQLWASGYSKDPLIDKCIRHLRTLAMTFQFDLRFSHVGRQNIPGCDSLTRGPDAQFRADNPHFAQARPLLPPFLSWNTPPSASPTVGFLECHHTPTPCRG